MANGFNPFGAGMVQGEQLIMGPAAMLMAKKKAEQEQAFREAQLASQAPLTQAHINYLNALATGKGQGSAVQPSVTLQTGQPPQIVGQPPVAPTSAPIGQPTIPATASPAAPTPTGMPTSPTTPSSSSASQFVNQLAGISPGIQISPISHGRYTLAGAQTIVQDPANKQVYMGSSPTMSSKTLMQGRVGAISELQRAAPILNQAFEDYSGDPIQSHWRLSKDLIAAQHGNPNAIARLTNYQLALRLKPDLAMVISRGLMGSKPAVQTLAHVMHSQYMGLPMMGTGWMPHSVTVGSQKRYEQIIPALSQAAQERVMTGSYIPVSSQTVIEGGIPRPAYTHEPQAQQPQPQRPPQTITQLPQWKNQKEFDAWKATQSPEQLKAYQALRAQQLNAQQPGSP